jgi:pyridoxamine 5'-phosphate oxidase
VPHPAIDIAGIRKDYTLAALDEHIAGSDPLAFFHKWFSEAEAAQITEVNAMVLATTDSRHHPHARIVLLKGVDEQGFVFFTNYDSHKGLEIKETPRAALVFFWKELERQVRVEGIVEKIPGSESDQYFNSRPRGSRLGAWASPQSSEITDRGIIDANYAKYEKDFANTEIPRPPYWGGYRVAPYHIEFWQGRASRMHDRILFTKNEHGWVKSRLAP